MLFRSSRDATSVIRATVAAVLRRSQRVDDRVIAGTIPRFPALSLTHGTDEFLFGHTLGDTPFSVEGSATGVLVIAAPMGLAGLNNHVTKVFVGTLPLLLLALQRALDLRRSWWWAPASAA